MPTLATKTNRRKIELRRPRVPRYIQEINEAINQVSACLENSDSQV